MSAVPTRRAALGRALAWSGLCAAVLTGLPAWLVATWGWPPPTVGLGLRLGGFPASPGPGAGVGLIDVAVWAAWAGVAWFGAALAVEVTQALSGRTPRRLLGLGPAQALAARAVGAILLFRALSGATAPVEPASLVTAHQFVAPAPELEPAVDVEDPAYPGPGPTAQAQPSTAPVPVGATYVVVRGDTLWGIASSQLGDPLRWPQIAALNYARPQPDGRVLTSAHWIYPGWVLVLPATAPDGPSPRGVPAPTPRATAPAAPPAATPRPAPVGSTPTSAPARTPAPASSNGSTPGVPEPASQPGDPLPVPARAGLATAGVIATVEVLRRVQQRHRRAGRRIRLPDGEAALAEVRLRRPARTERSELLNRGLAALGAALVGAAREVPIPTTIVVGDEVLEVAVGTGAGEPPAGFGSWPGTWLVDRAAAADPAPAPQPWPALVSVGAQDTHDVLVNLEAAGTLSVDGEAGTVTAALRAMAAELATSAWAATVDLVLVGFDDTLGPAQRSRSAPLLSEVVAEVGFRRQEADRVLAGSGHAGFAAARLAEGGDAWEPMVVVSLCAPSAAEAAALSDAARTGGPVAVVAPGLVGANWRLDLSGPDAVLDPLAVRVQPALMAEEDWDGLGELLAVGADTSDVPPDADSDVLPVVVDPAVEIDLREEAESGNGTAPSVAVATAATDEQDEASGEDAIADAPVVWPPEPEVEVLLLGPVDLRGNAVEPARGKYTEVIARLAIAERPVSTDELVTDLWAGAAAQSTVDTNVSHARDVLGTRADGTPRITRTRGWGDRGLDDSVRSDWWRFRFLADQATPPARRAALELVRGRPFEGLRAEWPSKFVPHMSSVIVDVAEAAATDCLEAGDPGGARWAARQGLAVAEYEERLWRVLMRAAHDESGVAAMEAIFEECARTLEATVEPFDSLQPETIELYLRLGGRRRSARPEHSAAVRPG